MIDYIREYLVVIERSDDDKNVWFTDSDKNRRNKINNNDIRLFVSILINIETKDFYKINKLIKYLKNVSTLLNTLELTIV